MINHIISALVSVLVLAGVWTGAAINDRPENGFIEPHLGAFNDPFLSIQLATSPSSGNCLTTDGTSNAWGDCGSGGGSGFSTTSTDYWLGTKSTSNLSEGSNLYYTDARVASYLTGSTTLPSFLNYWTLSGSNVYRASGSVGIGTTSPATRLAIYGSGSGSTINLNDSAYLSTHSATGNRSASLGTNAYWNGSSYVTYNASESGAALEVHRGAGQFRFGTVAAGGGSLTVDSVLGMGGGNSYFNANGGNVGVATSTPVRNLDVNGSSATLGLTSPSGSTRLVMGNRDSSAIPSVVESANGNTYIARGSSFASAGAGTMSYTAVFGSTGNVGIGTTSPATRFHAVANSSGAATANLTNLSASGYSGLDVTDETSAVAASFLRGNSSASVLPSSLFVGTRNATDSFHLVSGATTPTPRVTILPSGNVGVGTTSPWAQLSVNPSGVPGAAFAVGSSTATKLVVTNGGLVGVGTAAPELPLDVYGGLGSRSSLYVYSGAIVNYAGTINNVCNGCASTVINSSDISNSGLFVGGGSANDGYLTLSSASNGFGGSGDYINFKVGSGGATEAVRVISNGNVGIGTTSPSKRLSIQGDALVSGDLAVAGITATSTVSMSGTVNVTGTLVATVRQYPTFTYATSTAWTGTTTLPLGPAYVAETWGGVKCFTDAGTLNVRFTDGTNAMNMFQASTTVGTVTLSTNNLFTTSEKRYAEVGTPASSPTSISCTVYKSLSTN